MFVLFLVVGSRVFDPPTSALTNFTEFRYFSIAGGRILSLMNEPEMKGERQSPEAGDIRFEHVSFAYQDKEVLHDITVTLPKNSLTALVGPSGSWKSTVMKLRARSTTCIFFGGVPMDEIVPESLMSHISMVFQDVYLFQDTIRNNIHFGKTDATDEEIIATAKKPVATASSCACRRATTRWWAKEAVPCPEARSSAYPLPTGSKQSRMPTG